VKAFSTYVLAGIILFASLNIPVFVHTCDLFERSEVSLYHAKVCCEQAGLSVNCCHTDQETLSFAGFTPISYTIDLSSGFEWITTERPVYALGDSFEVHLATQDIRPPPNPDDGRTILTRLQVFRI
jgi:hypothetical protein